METSGILCFNSGFCSANKSKKIFEISTLLFAAKFIGIEYLFASLPVDLSMANKFALLQLIANARLFLSVFMISSSLL